MSQKLWNESIGQIDQELVEEYVQQLQIIENRKKRRRAFLRLGAMAACFCLIVGAVWTAYKLTGDLPGELPTLGSDQPRESTQTTETQALITEPTQVSTVGFREPLTQLKFPAPQYYGSSQAGIFWKSSVQIEPSWRGMCFSAKIVEVLPDIFTCYDDPNQYEFMLLKLKTLSVLRGQNMPEYFYYMIPEQFMTDFTGCDTLVIKDASQYYFEYQVVYNKSKGYAQQLEYSLFGFALRHWMYCDYIIPFDENGQYAPGLWQSTDVWVEGTQGRVPDATLEEAENRLRLPERTENPYGSVYDHMGANSLHGAVGEVAKMLERITDLANGVYVQRHYAPLNNTTLSGTLFIADRYIDGFVTNEVVSINSSAQAIAEKGKVSVSEACFDANDLKALPDLPGAVAAITEEFEAGNLKPSHLLDYAQMTLANKEIFGWYAKTGDGVLGIVRVSWKYREGQGAASKFYYDDAYYLITYGDEECVPISRDDLVQRFGEYETSYIFRGEYDSNGKIIPQY